MAEITEKQEVALQTISEKVTKDQTFLSKVIEGVKDFVNPKTEVKLESYTLENGVEVEEENGDVFIMGEEGERVPAPVGEHLLEDGRILVVVQEGKLSEIKEAVNEEVEAGEQVEFASMEEFNALKKEVEDLKAMIQPKEENVEMAEEVKEETKLEAVETEKVELSEETKDIKHSPEKEVNKVKMNLYAQNRNNTIKDNIYNQLFG